MLIGLDSIDTRLGVVFHLFFFKVQSPSPPHFLVGIVWFIYFFIYFCIHTFLHSFTRRDLNLYSPW